ncbi:hypothetical protein HG536_0H02690 [Torulaspora globosa]|uniref:20S-pre-rRNA D-site endonuclease NOB1 n=1 Tax=Torulaspora globosa TaxID=48254 RepID=A0A7G3ZN08_9SACH|nr:uncharacterized protein HG536_0H02690 [Torulaspora globosa]QLL34894.1 hypothetical protein HG536_0H02690 [Torulaspora globosa]
MSTDAVAHVRALVLDATPLITQPYTHYQHYAQSFYTCPTVFNEIKDTNARKNLEIWESLGVLRLRHPARESIDRVSAFAKLTGDYSVLSANDIHILALTYELEAELNKGDWRLRRKPGDSLDHLDEEKADQSEAVAQAAESQQDKPKKNRRRGGKKQRAKREAREAEASAAQDSAASGDDEDADDGEWITVDNLTEVMIRDSGEDTTGARGVEATEKERIIALNAPKNQVALATGDFAVQNVALQMNLNLMNFMSGLKIRRLRNYMMRCHACFKLFPLPKDGNPTHFCPSCGGQGTLLRCAVSVDGQTGEVTPHLKANFQWINRGNRYSIASPLSKNSQRKYGNRGTVHSKPHDSDLIVREDQKEYQKALKQDEWTKKHNEKILNDWIGGGSADNYMSPFAITGLKSHTVRVGRGRNANSTRKKR